jgi:hypothetical protein
VIEIDSSIGRLVVTEEPLRIRFESEAFVIGQIRGYAAAAYVLSTKQKRRHYLLLGAKSIYEQLEPLREANNGALLGIEVWIRKAGTEKTSAYILEE